MPQAQIAFDELRNSLWMLAIPLVITGYSIIAVFQWDIGISEWEERQREAGPSEIELVANEVCDQATRPEGAVCAISAGWWQPADPELCGGTAPCYQLAEMAELNELEQDYLPLIVPGLLPLLLIPLVMRKITRARSVLRTDTD